MSRFSKYNVTPQPRPDAQDGELSARGLRILIIEDDVIIGMMMREILADMGHTICAIEATEAGGIKAALRDKPDLMIVDVRLCEGDGISAVETILLRGSIPHIFVTGDAANTRVRKPGAIILEKPYREADLVNAMKHAMDIIVFP